MSAKFERDGLNLTRGLLDYVRQATTLEGAGARAIREETAKMPQAPMMIAPEQAQVMAVLARLARPRRIVEVGVLTGYSAAWLLEALEPGGVLVACDINEEYMALAQAHWDKMGVGDRIDVRLGPGAESLQALLDEGWAGTVDVMFVDADKVGYDTYYTYGKELLRPGGVMFFDNVLWGGSVVDPEDQSDDTRALRAISARARDDDEVHAALLTTGDGVLVVFKPFDEEDTP